MASAGGYRLPAEWEPHAATWIAWPHRRATFLGDFAVIPAFFARFIRLLAAYEPVKVIASGPALEEARERLRGVADVECIDIPTNDSWLRDTGPVFLIPCEPAPREPRARGQNGGPVAVCWDWNAWGGKYPPWDQDARVARAIAERLGAEVVAPGVVLEGGAIETDGAGTLLVNHRCVVDPKRNPGLSREQLEQVLVDQLAADRVIWLGGELAGDDTDGHIDQLARFVAPGRVVAARQPDRRDPNHGSLEANLVTLAAAVDARGRRLEVIPINVPSQFGFEGVQLPASHLNFYVANGAVLVPVFGGPTDEPAVRTLAGCFPGRRIVPVDCRELVRGRGALHCITRDQPVC
ncbi:MAG: agmatine/peptidylarginine deiminase [Planctomycetia bacterium]